MKVASSIKILIAGVVLLAIGAGLKLLGHYTSEETLRKVVQQEFARAVEGSLAVGAIQLGLDGTVKLGDVAVRPAGATEQVLSVARVACRFDVPRMLGLELVPEKIVVVGPRLRLLQDSDGGWNFQAIKLKRGAGREPAEGFLTGGVAVEDGAVAITSPALFGDEETRLYDGLDIRLRPSYASLSRWDFEGLSKGALLEGLTFSGWVDASDGPSLRLKAGTSRLLVGESLIKAVPFVGRQIWDTYKPRGVVAFQAEVDYNPGESLRDYQLLLELKEGQAEPHDLPLVVSAVQGRVEVFGPRIRARNISAVAELTEQLPDEKSIPPVKCRADVELDREEGTLTLDVRADDVLMCEQVVRLVPAVGDMLWADLQPEGFADIRVRSDGPLGKVGAGLLVEVTLKNAAASTKYFPLPVKALKGCVEVTGETVRFHDISGLAIADEAGGDGRFVLNGAYDIARRWTDLTVRLDAFPVTQRLTAALPGLDGSLQESLQPDLRIAGTFSLRGERDSMDYSADLKLLGGTLAGGPLPTISNLSGDLELAGEKIRFVNVGGTLRQPGGQAGAGRFTVNGVFDLRAREVDLTIALDNVSITADLVENLPEVRSLIDKYRPSALTAAGTVYVSGPLESPEWDVDLWVRAAGLAAEQLPMSVTNLSARVERQGDSILFRDVTCNLQEGVSDGPGTALLRLEGRYDMAGRELFGHIDLTNLRLQAEMAENIPGPGAELWKQCEPQGAVSVAGNIIWRAASEPALSYLLELSLKNVGFTWHGIPVESMFGQVSITPGRAVTSNVRGIVCEGPFASVGRVTFGGGRQPSGSATVNFRQLDLQRLITLLQGEESEVRGSVEGIADFSFPPAGEEGRWGEGRLTLTNAQLWEAPVFLGLLQMVQLSVPKGRNAFEDGKVEFYLTKDAVQLPVFELVGAVEVNGYGKVGFDKVLDLIVVGAVAPTEGWEIPIISRVVRAVVSGVERQIFKMNITGTLQDPKYEHGTLRRLTHPVASLRDLLFGARKD